MKNLVKICGITTIEEIEFINEAKPDFAGFVLFVSKSKRNISVEQAKKLLENLDSQIKSVAVTISPDERKLQMIEEAGFDYVQIHGAISSALLDKTKIPVIKAFNVGDLSEYEIYHNHSNVAGYVFDAQVPGSGKEFDWTLLEQIPRDEKFALLAGGLNPSNVKKAISVTKIHGADTSSGVENENGIGKDRNKILKFVKCVRETDKE